MSLYKKFQALSDNYKMFKHSCRNPFELTFDEILSPTEGVLNGQRVLLLGTNNYLGLTCDPDCIESSVEAVRNFGTGTTGSRIANGSYDGHRQLEQAIARFYGRRHCMVFSTGYQTNLGILSTLVGKDDHLIIDADSHASIYDGSKLGHSEVVRFRHNDPEDLRKRLRRLGDRPGEKLVVVEGIYSMLGDAAPLREIAEVTREYGAYLLVDEAHSMGVLGAHGRGLAEETNVEKDVDFIIGTFSKSLGSVGGFCVSNHAEFDILRIACRPYMFTASLPPAVIASTLEALNQMERRPELRAQLMVNAARLYNGLDRMGFTLGPTINPIVSVTVPEQEVAFDFWNRLLDQGVYLNLSLPPATPHGLPLLRSSVSAMHTASQIDMALDCFEQIGSDLGLLAGYASKQLAYGAASD